jgi:hypothetical protein
VLKAWAVVNGSTTPAIAEPATATAATAPEMKVEETRIAKTPGAMLRAMAHTPVQAVTAETVGKRPRTQDDRPRDRKRHSDFDVRCSQGLRHVHAEHLLHPTKRKRQARTITIAGDDGSFRQPSLAWGTTCHASKSQIAIAVA